jgi:uroporphyrinogen III methyltransferase/synthase
MAYGAYGKVFLVGAGPGDPALITVKGAECVRKADVILFDRLVHPRIWSSRKGECELIYVGKTPERPMLEQDEINGLLVEKARAGKTVVRLKGGDPFVFGRGGEEALALAEAGIDFEIVPGVTAAIASAAYAGIPVTHRGVSAGLTLATAHEAPAREKDAVNWAKIAAAGGTVAAYMGVKNLRRVCRGLRAGGMPPGTPVAVIQDGTLPGQRTIMGTLATIADLAGKAGVRPPATAVFGEVVGLRDKLNWFEKRPLFGRKIIVTRAQAQAAEMMQRLEDLGAETIPFPTIRIEPPDDGRPLDEAIENLRRFDWVVFTSVNGVDAFMRRLAALGRDARALGHIRLCAIGPVTAGRLAHYHLLVDCVPERFTSEEVVAALRKIEGVRGKSFLLPRSDIARSTLPDGLRELGCRVTEVVAYRIAGGLDETAGPILFDLIKSGEIAYITFTSPSTARNFASYFDAGQLKTIAGKTRIAGIGPVTGEALRAIGLPPDVEADEFTVAGLVDAILEETGT